MNSEENQNFPQIYENLLLRDFLRNLLLRDILRKSGRIQPDTLS